MEGLGIMFDNRYANKTVLVTGHTGFKGSWLSLWLHRLGAKVVGLSLDPPTSPANFNVSEISSLLLDHRIADIRDQSMVEAIVRDHKPEFIFHLAAQPLVRLSYECPRETFDVNVMGTACVLDAVRAVAHPTNVVIVTSDKCYENREQVWGYREDDSMGGHDPYSASKGCTEVLAASYRRSFFPANRVHEHGICVATARAGNVIGGGDWAKDRIMTDIVAALANGQPVNVRNPHAVRPWQHVLEPLSGYLTLAAGMERTKAPELCSGWNFGPTEGSTITVGQLCDIAVAEWGTGCWNDLSSGSHLHEAAILRLCIDKSTTALGWNPCWSVNECISRTINWYRKAASADSMREASLIDIQAYENAMKPVSLKIKQAA